MGEVVTLSPEVSAGLVAERFDRGVRQLLYRVFLLMTASLLLTALSAQLAAQALLDEDTASKLALYGRLLFVFEMISVLVLSRYVRSFVLFADVAVLVFFSLLNGITFTCTLRLFGGCSVVRSAALAAVVFAVMGLFARFYGTDLRRGRSVLAMTAGGVILAIPCKLLTSQGTMTAVLLVLTVAVFANLVSHHKDDLTDLYEEFDDDPSEWKSAVCGALLLSLSFVNLYLLAASTVGRWGSRASEEDE
jgi:FtsH-binding integral membrane protein